MELVFVSGKYRAKTEWELEQNIRHAESVAQKIWQANKVAICPHLNTAHFGGICGDGVWLAGDLEIVKRCDSIYMLKGFKQSEGAMAELRLALKLGLKVYYEEADEV